MKPLRVDSEEEFERLLNDISEQVSDAFEPWRLLQRLDAAFSDYAAEMNYAPGFWNLVFQSLYETVISYLGRLYDATSGSLSLGNFLHTIKSNPQYFCEHAFLRRLGSRPHVDTLATMTRTVDAYELEMEIMCVSRNNSFVKCLHDIRNKRVAHRDGQMVRLDTLSSLTGLTEAQTEELLMRASQITSKYDSLFRASSTRTLVRDDYNRVLRLMKQSIDFNRTQEDEEIRKLLER